MGRISKVLILAVLIIGPLAGAGYYVLMTQTPNQTSVTYAFSFSLSPAMSPIFFALNKGYFSQDGLQVNYVPTTGSSDALIRLLTGQVQFADVSTVTGTISRANGSDVKYVFGSVVVNPGEIFTLKKYNIISPADLQGKTIGTSFSGVSYGLMKVYCQKAGINCNSINFQNILPSTYMSLLLSGQIQAFVDYSYAVPTNNSSAVKAGQTLVLFPMNTYFPVYGNSLATTDSFIQAHPDIVRTFIKDYTRGWVESVKNETLAGQIDTNYITTLSQPVATADWQSYLDVCKNNFTQAGGWGYMSDSGWAATINFTQTNYRMKQTILPGDMYTNEFLVPLSQQQQIAIITRSGSSSLTLVANVIPIGKPE